MDETEKRRRPRRGPHGDPTPAFSVVIPTHNRIDALPEVLRALEAQAEEPEAPSFEIVVVDDGSVDGTGDWLAGRRLQVPSTVLRQENRGPAAARNAGVEAASGHRVAFLGDDTVPEPGWLAAHRWAHRERGDLRELAVLGHTGWHRRIAVTPFLRYLNQRGAQFGYGLIADRERVPFNFFYTSNISLSRELLLAEPFDLGFPYPAWEDTELSYRLHRRHGLRLVYEPAAVTRHNHPTDLDRFCARQEKAGYCAVVFHRLHPELGGFLGLGPEGPPPLPRAGPQRWRERLARTLQSLSVVMPLSTPRLWDETLRYHYIRGLHRGSREETVSEERSTHVPRQAGPQET
jgi:glycosyltransferase involved in cell wall biosynthesis